MLPFKKISGLRPQPRWGAQRPPDLHLQSTSIHRWLRPCKLLIFINSKNLRTIRKLIAYENFQDCSKQFSEDMPFNGNMQSGIFFFCSLLSRLCLSFRPWLMSVAAAFLCYGLKLNSRLSHQGQGETQTISMPMVWKAHCMAKKGKKTQASRQFEFRDKYQGLNLHQDAHEQSTVTWYEFL